MSDKKETLVSETVSSLAHGSQHTEIYAFPASYGQKQLYFLYQMDKESAVYNIAGAFRMKGKLSGQLIEKSINKVVQRHETFRTTFSFKNGSLSQFISSNLQINLELFDFQSVPVNELQAEEKISEFILKPFNLETGPLIRTGLIALNPEEHILLFSFHHIVVDHTAVLLFLKEFSFLYNSYLENRNPEFQQPNIQYADIVVWQQDAKQVASLRPKLEYWKQQLKDQTSYLGFPLDKKRPARQTFNGKEIQLNLSIELSNKIREFSRREKKSLFTVLLAAYKILLYRYTDKTDITIGCPFANRTKVFMEDVMGCCMNTLPLRTKFSVEESFMDFLSKVSDVTLGAQANQEISFEQIVEETHPIRDGSYNPLFQFSFMFQEPLTTIQLKNIQCSSIQIRSYTSKFDFTFWMWDEPDGFQTLIQYNTDLFHEETINRVFNNYVSLLRELVQTPDKKIFEFDILSEKEKHFILTDLNRTQVDYPNEMCIHHLFEKSVKKIPDNIAVIFINEKITYNELNKRANKLANYLCQAGIEAESTVGIFLDRSIDMVIGIIAILKAGATYVPMDPSFPRDRLEFMISDAGIRTVITQEKYSGWFENFDGTEICIDRVSDKIMQMSASNLDLIISSKNLAYVIYTSGSTGRPKGVQVEHKAFVNFILSMEKEPGLNLRDVFLSITTLSFDIAGLEIFLPLIVGAKIILVSKDATLDGKILLKLLDSQKVTAMQATPATYNLMLSSGWKNKKQLKLFCGGEALPSDLAKKLVSVSSELWNMYGPTETTVWSTVKKITDFDNVTIGRPINNTSVYILDTYLKPVPIGVIGELYIGGDGLARGYLNRPELNEESFIQNRVNGVTRIYKTGDLARYRTDGEIECLGRIDNQVKIRGYRIELGEIETVLATYPEINNVVVNAWEDSSGDKKLAAYYVPSNDAVLEISKLRSFLSKKLPEYMIPSYFIKMDRFPLTPNAKIDRKKLPPPDISEVSYKEKFIAPTDELELQLAEIWKRVLKIKSVGINDNFFELGGHSLLVIHLFNQIESELNVELSIATIFESPTISQLAKKIMEELEITN